LGYFRNPEATSEATTADGFFRTGDVGRLRGDGSVMYETRAGDAMRLGGFLGSPGEVEGPRKSWTRGWEGRVGGVDIDGHARCAAFVIADDAPPTESALIGHVGQRLARYKVPARIFFVDAFPVTESANGVKIQRAKLRAKAMETIAAEARSS